MTSDLNTIEARLFFRKDPAEAFANLIQNLIRACADTNIVIRPRLVSESDLAFAVGGLTMSVVRSGRALDLSEYNLVNRPEAALIQPAIVRRRLMQHEPIRHHPVASLHKPATLAENPNKSPETMATMRNALGMPTLTQYLTPFSGTRAKGADTSHPARRFRDAPQRHSRHDRTVQHRAGPAKPGAVAKVRLGSKHLTPPLPRQVEPPNTTLRNFKISLIYLKSAAIPPHYFTRLHINETGWRN